MRHVEIGELHAYLDGALDQLGTERSIQVRDHLRACGACRERLAEEREMREAADAILATSAPDIGDPPPFEEIRRRAVGSGGDGPDQGAVPPVSASRGARGIFLGLGWAASVALAVGVGYGLRATADVQAPDRSGVAMVEPATSAVVDASSPPSTGAAESTQQSSAVEVVSIASESLVTESGVDGAAGEHTRPAEAAEASADRASAADMAPARIAESRPAAEEDAPIEGAAGQTVRSDSPDASSSLVSDAGAWNEAERPEATARVGGDEPTMTMAEALGLEREPMALASVVGDDLASLAVPDLEILGIEVDPGVPGRAGFRILQRLPMGDTLELRYFGVLSDPSGRFKEAVGEPRALIPFRDLPNPPLKPGWNQVVLKKGNGWLVARAPMPEESLGFLLSLLQ
jgi:hypothetical protein